MRWRKSVICCCGLWASIALSAGETRATSIYSMVFVGERVESGDVRAIALGGSTQLVSDSLGVLSSNPALLSRIRLVALGASQLLAMDEGRSDDYTERDNSFLFPALRFAFPIANRLVFSVGFASRFDPDGSFEVDSTTASGDAFTKAYTRSGGLFALPFTLAADITRFASAGFTLSLERGNVEERWDTIFEDPSFASAAEFQKAEVKGTGFGGGLVLRPVNGLLIGGTYDSAVDYDAEVRRQYTQSSLDTAFSTTGKLPARASVGLTWGFGSWLLLGSYAWSDFTEFVGLGFPAARLDTETSYAFGVEYGGIPVGSRRLPIRVSFNYQQLAFDHPQGKTIDKFLIGLGTGLSVQGGRGKFDIAIQGGKSGALNENGLEDRLIRLYVGLVGGERWSRRAPQ